MHPDWFPFNLIESVGIVSLIAHLIGFMIAMGSTSRKVAFYGCLASFITGIVLFISVCAFALWKTKNSVSKWIIIFYTGFILLLTAPATFIFPSYEISFLACLVPGSILTVGSFYFINIFDHHVNVADHGRIWPLPNKVPVLHIRFGELLRSGVLVGLILGIIGSCLFEYYSFRGAVICVIISAVLMSFCLVIGRRSARRIFIYPTL